MRLRTTHNTSICNLPLNKQLCVYLSVEHSASWSCGRPHALTKRMHFSRLVLGFGNKISSTSFCNLSGYLSSTLEVPHTRRKTIIQQFCAILQTSHKFVCGTTWRLIEACLSLIVRNDLIG